MLSIKLFRYKKPLIGYIVIIIQIGFLKFCWDSWRKDELRDNLTDSWKFKSFRPSEWNYSQIITLTEDHSQYFRQISPDLECFIEGTNWTRSIGSGACNCIESYFGKDCGIPESVWYGHYSTHPDEMYVLKRREIPRRIIQGLLFHHEFDMLEIRVASSHDLVDVFIVQESNYSSIGVPKSLSLYEELSRGWLKEYQDKILYTPLLFFSEPWHSNGWLVENYIRNHLSQAGLPLITNKKNDDIFLLFDADEIPNRASLLFLKLYNGYSEPLQFNLRWNLYGFFWLKAQGLLPKFESMTNINCGCTLGMLEQVYGNHALNIRKNDYESLEFRNKALKYAKNNLLRTWTLGALEHYAGYHCSWCFRPEGIRSKLLSAQKEDKPRWGDYPEKIRLSYIASLIKAGGWFDGSYPTIRADSFDPYFAPKYVLQNPKRFSHLLSIKKTK